VFDDVVEVAPLASIEEVAGCSCAHPPDVGELVESDEVRVFVETFGSRKGATFRGFELGEKIGDFVVTAREGKDLGRAPDLVWVRCYRGDGGTIRPYTDVIEVELADGADFNELLDEVLIWWIEG
jgi:hypothetical protein